MYLLLFLSSVTILGLFILFLVVSKTLNNIINQLLKIEYMLQREVEYLEEERHIKMMIQENAQSSGEPPA